MNAFSLSRSQSGLLPGDGLLPPSSFGVNPVFDPAFYKPIFDWLEGGETLDQAGGAKGFDNLFTGNLDYARQKALQDAANAYSWKAQKDTQDFNSNEAQVQRDWEEMMSNSAYTRAFADIRKQGLNPYILASPASTPSGASASSPTSFGAHASAGRSGQAFALLLGAIINGAFSLARSAISKPGSPTGYLDTWIDSQGEIRGYRRRQY